MRAAQRKSSKKARRRMDISIDVEDTSTIDIETSITEPLDVDITITE